MESREVRALARLGIADPYEDRGLMATRRRRGRLAAVARNALADLRRRREQTLRDQIEEAIDEAEDERPVAGDLSPTERQMLRNLLHFGERTAGDICVTRGDIIAVPVDDQLRRAGPRVRRRRSTAACRSTARASTKSSA